MEARQLQEKFEAESRNVDLVEKEAHDFLENAKAALQETTVRSEEEVQMCAYKLLALIDSVSKYKEFTASKISQMKDVVSETAAAIAQVHNDSLASSKIFWIRAKEVTGWSPNFNDGDDDLSDLDYESLVVKNNEIQNNETSEVDSEEKYKDDPKDVESADPFNIYELLNKKHSINNEVNQSEGEPKYPPGFTPRDASEVNSNMEQKPIEEDNDCNQKSHELSNMKKDSNASLKEDVDGCVCSGHFKSVEIPKSGGLVEVSSGGYSFTWSHRSASKMSKLDHFLISEDLMRSHPNIFAIILDHYLSDHRPILLREINFDYGPTPFRFYHYRFQLEGFDSFVAETWSHISISEPNAMLRLLKKLKVLKMKIRVWVNNKKDKTHNYKKGLKKLLVEIDSSFDKGDATPETLEERINIMNKLSALENLDSLELAQKTKVKWLIEGDENSRYFHGIINKKRNNLAICGILVEGAWIEDPKVVKNEFFIHFKERFNNPCSSRFTLDMDFPNKLSTEQVNDLEHPFTKEDIKAASLLQPDVLDAANHFYTHGFCPNGGNSSFIALIPKTQDAKLVKDFKPISLIGSLYKIIAKLLANRLMLVIGDLVHEVQSAFIEYRQILDGPFILNELIQWCKHKKKQTMIFKVDFEKAFDSVRWDFLDDVLKNFGFGDRWCDWIQSWLRSSKGSILVNGSPTSEFQFHKGLRIIIHKSKLMGVGVENSKVDLAATNMGCMTLKLPFSYLGVKVGGRMTRINSWDEISNNLLSRLSKWKMKTLSIGGRLMLLKSVLGSMPIYYMSMFKVPIQVLKKIESIRSHFFNGVDHNDRKLLFVKWDNVLASKEKGGLGVSSFYALNRALIFKWVWRFKTQSSFLWSRVIKAIHGVDGKLGMDLCGFIKKKMGNGENTMFWNETWKGDVPFKSLYPRIYALESDKGITFASKMAQP
ncbi:RNA-directed DNA polymerase, eukaryota, reverse transcriptase zinc-binding domain protein, partial [Tanacetum coccineum]